MTGGQEDCLQSVYCGAKLLRYDDFLLLDSILQVLWVVVSKSRYWYILGVYELNLENTLSLYYI